MNRATLFLIAVTASLLLPPLPATTQTESNRDGGLFLEPISEQIDKISERKEGWRREEYELFSWREFPTILIIYLSDYKVQARYMKRLAYFVEKKGYTGTLLSNRELEGRHGWNAHDYNSTDLAAFFNKAEESRFPLNREEEELKGLLLYNKILIMDRGKIKPGGGALLSIAKETSDQLRERFLIHEGFHGLFFISPDYQKALFEIWNNVLDSRDREFWGTLLREYREYNDDDTELMVNELQAYLMQMEISKVESYLRNMGYRVAKKSPSKAFLIDYLNSKNGQFLMWAEAVEREVKTLFGFSAGSLTRE